jgi:cell division protein FtsQ
MSAQPFTTSHSSYFTVPDQSVMAHGRYMLPGVVFTLAILLLAGFTITRLMEPTTLPIRHVTVTGDFKHLSTPRLEQSVSDVVRGGFFSVNVDVIKRALLQEPWVKEVTVRRIWPDRITVNIGEQIAVAQWGDTGLVNPAAEVFFPDRATFPAGLPVLSGPDQTSRQVLNLYMRVRELLPPGMLITKLSLSERRSWALYLEHGPVIHLGKSGVVARIQRLVKYFPPDEIGKLRQIEYIDMRYPNGFAIRWNRDLKPDQESGQQSYGEKI